MTPAPLVQLVELEGLERFEHEAMATRFTLHLAPQVGVSLRQVADSAFVLLDQIEERLSFYREGSDVTRINRAPVGERLRVDELTHHCLLTAIEVAAATHNAFDPFTGGPSLSAKNQSIPAHLRDLGRPDLDDRQPVLAIDPDQPIVTKLTGTRWLDLGAVGKGIALDAMAAHVKEWDVPAAVLVGGGSSVLVYGRPVTADAQRWTLRLPQVSGSPSLQITAPFALGASGLGFQPGHIIAPAGFKQREQSLVLAPDAALADALSTAVLVLPDDDVEALFAPLSDCAVMATRSEGSPLRSGVFNEWRHPAPQASLVIPCWRESQRLPQFLNALAQAIDDAGLPVEILVVDDGSPPDDAAATRACVAAVAEKHPRVRPLLDLDRHRGKGGAVYGGWRQAAASSRCLAFVDADGAIPPDEVARGLRAVLSRPDDAPPVLMAASRYHRDRSRRVSRGAIRQRTGAWFASWSKRKLNLGADDSQCGFKIVPAAWWRAREPWLVEGYDFDLELLTAARDDRLDVMNLPIAWSEMAGSHVGIGDGIRLVRNVTALSRVQRD